MARDLYLYMWEPQRQHFLERHDFYAEQTKARVLSQFRDIDGEATKHADEFYKSVASAYYTEDGDLSEVAQDAQEAGLERYELLDNLKAQTFQGAVAGVYHQWEKDFRKFLEQELRRQVEDAAVWAWEKTRTFDDIFDVLAQFGWDCRSDSFYATMDACRVIVNVYKHGKGASLRQLLAKYPEYLDPHSLAFGDQSFAESLGHEALLITEETFDRFATAIRVFWEKIPENLSEALAKRLTQAAAWSFPPSKWEGDLVKEVSDIPVLTIRRARPDMMEKFGCQAHECHVNARRFAEGVDPTGMTKAVAGWWVQGSVMVLHSVIENRGEYCCVTPTEDGKNAIYFRPDPKISWLPTGDVRSAVRNGQMIGVGLRLFPRAMIRHEAIVKERLLAGASPDEEICLTPEEEEELKQLSAEDRAARDAA